jgi:hypothetical protein
LTPNSPPSRRAIALGIVSLAVVAVVANRSGLINQGPSASGTSPAGPSSDHSIIPSPSAVAKWSEIRWHRASGDPGIGHDPALNQWIGGVVAGGPGYVAWGLDEKRLPDGIGSSMAIWVSEDASTWREVTFEPGETLTRRFSIRDIAAGPTGLVAVGGICCREIRPNFWEETPARWFSPDGDRWTRAVEVGLQPDDDNSLVAAAGRGGFVEVGTANGQPAAWFSTDGRNWTAKSLGVRGFSFGLAADVTTDALGWVAVGHVSNDREAIGVVWRSPDGIDWHQVASSDRVLTAGPVESLERVVSYPGGLFAIGTRELPIQEQTCSPVPAGDNEPPSCVTTERVHLFSPDGEGWSDVPIGQPVEGELYDPPPRLVIGDDSGLLVMAGAYEPDAFWPVEHLWTSVDGLRWSRADEKPSLAERDHVSGFIVAGDRIVAVGQDTDSAAVWIGTQQPAVR